MPLAKNQMLPLSIHQLSSDGNGVGRVDGQAVFVPGAAQGDLLRVKIVKPAKTYAYARIEQVITPGPGRVKPDCPVSNVCGGCSFRHLSYKAELAAKQGFVVDALRRIGHLEVEVLPILPSPQENRYRNKVQYPVAPAPDGSLSYGFYASRSHRVVPCSDCLLQPQALNHIATRSAELLRQHGVPAYDEATQTGLIRHLYLRQGFHTGEVLLCFVSRKPRVKGLDEVANALASEFLQLKTVVLNHNPANTNVILGSETRVLLGNGFIRETICGVPLLLNAASFSQVNTEGAEQLFGVVQALAAPQPADTLLDLYCGAGVIGLSMAARCKELIGVEIVPQAVESARQSAAEMGLASKSRFLCEDAGAAAARLEAEGLRPDIVTLDPPRKGSGEATLAAVVRMAPRRLVMVSCNPATLARDLVFLTEKGYHIRKVQPVDMFPKTRHVECVVLLEKAEFS